MKLIKVEAHGFKSFADKTSLSFDGGIVGIVGPNGSGKSNINDAIKWVLGERSIKSLRGKKAADVIFAGSEKVQQMNFAIVSLVFDNSERKVQINSDQIKITRKLTRDKGSNEYFINGEIAKLKDIETIAMESGISKSSLAIISQGTISNIAEASPDNRRGIFEEAAGVSKYKSRKDEALRKLDKTNDALEKVSAVVLEMQKQLKPLQKQAEKAKIYLVKKNELKDVEISLIIEDLSFFELSLKKLNAELEDVIRTKEDINLKISNSEIKIKDKNNYKLQLENEINDLQVKYQKINDELNLLKIAESQAQQRRQMIIDGQIKATNQERIKIIKDELQELSNKKNQYIIFEEDATNRITEKRRIINQYEQNILKIKSSLDLKKRNLFQLKAKINIFKENLNRKNNLFKGPRVVLENKNLFPGVYDVVPELIEIPNEYKNVINTLLRSSMQNIVVDNMDVAIKAINFLKNNNAGRATFLPLNAIRLKGIIQEHQSIASSVEVFISMASKLVKPLSPKFQILSSFLLGNTIITNSIESATKVSKLLQQRYMVASLDGDIIRPGGIMTGGESNKNNEMNQEEIKKLEEKIPTLEEEIKKMESEISNIQILITEEQTIISELNMELARIEQKKNIVLSQFNSLKAEYDSVEQKELKLNDSSTIGSINVLESEKSSITSLLKAKREILINLNQELSNINLEKTDLEKILRQIVESSSEKMTEKNQAEYVIKTSATRLAEEYELTLEGAKNLSLKPINNRDETREIVSRLRSEIKDLGNVNIDSIEQYDEIKGRYDKLKTNENELFEAKQTIISAIDEMDQIIISKLDETVKNVNKEINNVFQKMFGGGFAKVKYIDPTNILESGIEVAASPPGKIIKNLAALSGGEKSIVAMSLLFAILKYKPLPLCILDEVEAALDDANVVRYAEYLKELKEQTQFLVITHRHGTMSRVDHLFGATMQKRGVTSFFTVKLKEAQELIN